MYQSYIISLENIDDYIEEINQDKSEIISVASIPESQQILIIVKTGEEKKNILSLFKKVETEDEET